MNIVIDLLLCLTRRNVYSVVHHYRVFSERVFVSNMVGTVDRRSQSLKATRKWRDDWMAEVDKQGDRVGDWAQQVDIKTFRCRWCNTVRLDTSLHKYNSPANTPCFFVATKTSATGGQEYKKTGLASTLFFPRLANSTAAGNWHLPTTAAAASTRESLQGERAGLPSSPPWWWWTRRATRRCGWRRGAGRT